MEISIKLFTKNTIVLIFLDMFKYLSEMIYYFPIRYCGLLSKAENLDLTCLKKLDLILNNKARLAE